MEATFWTQQMRATTYMLSSEADMLETRRESYSRIAQVLLQDLREGYWLLTCVEHGTREDVFHPGGNPSWVPDWSMKKAKEMKADPYCRYEAGGPIGTFEAVPPEYGCMAITGFVFDTVILISLPLDDLTSLNSTTPDGCDSIIEPFVDCLWREFASQAKLQGVDVNHGAFLQTLFKGQLESSYEGYDGLGDYEAFHKVLLGEPKERQNPVQKHSPVVRT
ncbi:hypothetical protein BU25DRAFT_152145 [Macroventuria anomochaeta]|uniref:Uncharacterized protein n=1 Tax=Macroventuria anomochaeta TaxID=301207 RepID=A0ACB6SER7_9PLEO|nr:uncharacterized protein BU25DRAFT_152145 [Macroventuria anomochaeta]KAF2632458.1 hypothetical protein BU25DRAFT_152145 [Macroventuria anomochaeta]